MDALKELRTKIDSIDDKVFILLNERFTITSEVGKYKKDNSKVVLNLDRENEILDRISSFEFDSEIKKLYKKLFEISKDQQRK